MTGVIKGFEPVFLDRIAQLTNKSNQFNLTTRRYTQAEIEALAADPNVITLYGKLTDKYGDNGVVSVVIGKKQGEELHIGHVYPHPLDGLTAYQQNSRIGQHLHPYWDCL